MRPAVAEKSTARSSMRRKKPWSSPKFLAGLISPTRSTAGALPPFRRRSKRKLPPREKQRGLRSWESRRSWRKIPCTVPRSSPVRQHLWCTPQPKQLARRSTRPIPGSWEPSATPPRSCDEEIGPLPSPPAASLRPSPSSPDKQTGTRSLTDAPPAEGHRLSRSARDGRGVLKACEEKGTEG